MQCMHTTCVSFDDGYVLKVPCLFELFVLSRHHHSDINLWMFVRNEREGRGKRLYVRRWSDFDKKFTELLISLDIWFDERYAILRTLTKRTIIFISVAFYGREGFHSWKFDWINENQIHFRNVARLYQSAVFTFLLIACVKSSTSFYTGASKRLTWTNENLCLCSKHDINNNINKLNISSDIFFTRRLPCINMYVHKI